MSRITVFTARKIRTMEPSLPEATAVAVRDGMIVEVGTLETLRPWLEAHPHTIDRQFEKHVLMPGFIDPHLHPSMAAYLLQCEFITAMEWQLPDRTVAPVRTRDAFLARVKALHEAEPDPRQPLFTWGYHRDWHGDIWRADLNAISASRPIVVVHRSFHETILNDGAFAFFEIDEQKLAGAHQVDLPRGHFYEAGNRYLRATLSAYLLSKQRRGPAMKRTANGSRRSPPSTTTPRRSAWSSCRMSPSPAPACPSSNWPPCPNATRIACASASTSSCSPTVPSSPSSCSSADRATSTATTAPG